MGAGVGLGEVFRLRAPRGGRGREQRGIRYAVVVQADELLALSTVLVEQTTAVTPERLGKSAGRLSPQELNSLDRALVAVLGL